MVAIMSNGDGLHSTVERYTRIMVRARCGMPCQPFVETRNEFGKVKQFIVQLLADSGNTPTKEQACRAADCCLAHIMKPTEGGDLHNVLHGPCLNNQIALHEVMAAATLKTSVAEVGKLDTFTEKSTLTTNPPAINAVTRLTLKSPQGRFVACARVRYECAR
jgi:hypothetical protein